MLCSKKDALPASLSGMVNKYGTKVRLHFKLEQDQLWLGTHGESAIFDSLKMFTIPSY